MKKLLLKTTFLLSALCLTGTAAAEVIGPTTIDYLRSYEGYALIRISGNLGNNNDNCTHSSSDKTILIVMRNGAGKVQFATALSAYLAGREVKFETRLCSPLGGQTIPKSYGVHILP